MMWFYFLWMEYTAPFRSRIARMGEHRLNFRCMPTDVDLHLHMNNNRYFMFMDRVRFDLSLRSGFWRVMRSNDVMPVLGSLAIRFRKSVRLWERFDVTARIITWDERWLYMEHKILIGSELAAIAIAKSALVDGKGRISAEKFATLMAEAGPQPPPSDLAAAQNALDKLLTA